MENLTEEESKRSENINSIKNETKGFYFKYVKTKYSNKEDRDFSHWENGFNDIVRRLSNYTDKIKKEDFINSMFEVIDSAKNIYQLGDFKRYPIENYVFQTLDKEEIDKDIKNTLLIWLMVFIVIKQ